MHTALNPTPLMCTSPYTIITLMLLLAPLWQESKISTLRRVAHALLHRGLGFHSGSVMSLCGGKALHADVHMRS